MRDELLLNAATLSSFMPRDDEWHRENKAAELYRKKSNMVISARAFIMLEATLVLGRAAADRRCLDARR